MRFSALFALTEVAATRFRTVLCLSMFLVPIISVSVSSGSAMPFSAGIWPPSPLRSLRLQTWDPVRGSTISGTRKSSATRIRLKERR